LGGQGTDINGWLILGVVACLITSLAHSLRNPRAGPPLLTLYLSECIVIQLRCPQWWLRMELISSPTERCPDCMYLLLGTVKAYRFMECSWVKCGEV